MKKRKSVPPETLRRRPVTEEYNRRDKNNCTLPYNVEQEERGKISDLERQKARRKPELPPSSQGETPLARRVRGFHGREERIREGRRLPFLTIPHSTRPPASEKMAKPRFFSRSRRFFRPHASNHRFSLSQALVAPNAVINLASTLFYTSSSNSAWAAATSGRHQPREAAADGSGGGRPRRHGGRGRGGWSAAMAAPMAPRSPWANAVRVCDAKSSTAVSLRRGRGVRVIRPVHAIRAPAFGPLDPGARRRRCQRRSGGRRRARTGPAGRRLPGSRRRAARRFACSWDSPLKDQFR